MRPSVRQQLHSTGVYAATRCAKIGIFMVPGSDANDNTCSLREVLSLERRVRPRNMFLRVLERRAEIGG